MRVVGIDHLVLNVSSVEASLAFYTGALGLDGVRVDEWRRGEAPFPSIRVDESTIIDLFELPRSGENVDHFCLTIEPTDLTKLKVSGDFDVVDGPAIRFGARGGGESLYVRDPDGNTIELRYYPR